MAFSSADLRDVRAYWDEWVTDRYELSVKVGADSPQTEVVSGDGKLLARVGAHASRYCEIEISDLEAGRVIFSERCPHDARAVQASVRALARKVAEHQAPAG